jgi:hypothetical protein
MRFASRGFFLARVFLPVLRTFEEARKYAHRLTTRSSRILGPTIIAEASKLDRWIDA